LRSSLLFCCSNCSASGWSAATRATSPSGVCDSEILISPSELGESVICACVWPWRTAIVKLARTASIALCRSTGVLGDAAAEAV
jgi:hypothetical protein